MNELGHGEILDDEDGDDRLEDEDEQETSIGFDQQCDISLDDSKVRRRSDVQPKLSQKISVMPLPLTNKLFILINDLFS